MYRRTEKFFYECRSICLGADEIAEGPKDSAGPEAIPLTEKTSCRRGEPNALALEFLERVQLALERRVRFLRAEQRRARGGISIARGAQRGESRGVLGVSDRALAARLGERFLDAQKLAPDCGFGV